MATKITSSFITRVDRKTSINLTFEHIVDDELDAEEVGRKDAKLMQSYTEGFASQPVRRY